MIADSSLTERHSMEEQLKQYKATSSVTNEKKDDGIIAHPDGCGLLQFSKITQGEDKLWRSFCPEQSGRSEEHQWHRHQHRCHHHNHYRHHSKESNQKQPISAASRLKPEKEDEEAATSVTDSFGTLCVSNRCTSYGANNVAVSMPTSCRAEARNSAMCLDDTTVDDLAGYLDEIMFLPKPMSEMAELMYT